MTYKTARQILDSEMSEKQFTQQVIQLLTACGFEHVYHTWTSLHSPRGFPDIVALRTRDKRVLVVELKSENGKTTLAQEMWLAAFQCVGIPAYLWRPSDWEEIVGICSRPHPYRGESI
jgi:ABC-type ATPase with predicted acetyltransferase domain